MWYYYSPLPVPTSAVRNKGASELLSADADNYSVQENKGKLLDYLGLI